MKVTKKKKWWPFFCFKIWFLRKTSWQTGQFKQDKIKRKVEQKKVMLDNASGIHNNLLSNYVL